jgi:catechol 2,3-dioxygenase-like lactoylglutathione lyase family enzyme
LSWKRTRAATEATRGVRLFFLELAHERQRSAAIAAAPITAMDHVVVSTADPERAAALYGARLGLDMALDRSHPDWGRLMFFRCGDLIVEVVHRLQADLDRAQDKLWGLSWRRYRCDASAAGVGGRRCVRSAHRPQAGNAGADGAQRHLRHSHVAGGADGAVVILPHSNSGLLCVHAADGISDTLHAIARQQ